MGDIVKFEKRIDQLEEDSKAFKEELNNLKEVLIEIFDDQKKEIPEQIKRDAKMQDYFDSKMHRGKYVK